MKNNPLVSVIIPMYNSQEWISGLLQSILNQSYEDIEIILINDGSTDNSIELVSEIATNSGKKMIRIISQENSGVSVARNEGVRNSTGELIAFVDSDDIWLEHKVEDQVRVMVSQNLSASACSYAIFKDSNLEVLDVVHPNWSTRGVRNWLLFRSYGGLLSSTLMLRKEAFFETGPFRDDLSLSADIEFAWRLVSMHPVKLIREPLVAYRLRQNQMHKRSDLLISESKRMISAVNLFRSKKYSSIFLANLNFRLFLYSLQNRELHNSLPFLYKSLRLNGFEVSTTAFRIFVRRVSRKLRFYEKNSIYLPRP